jgi:FAD/FMN-containing dehydrogenase
MVVQWFRALNGAGWDAKAAFLPTEGTAGRVTAMTARAAPLPKLSILDRLDRWFWTQEQKRRDAYLAQATDRFDLESRMRNLERAGSGGFP